MSIFDPEQTSPEQDGEREDAPLPTRFGRDQRRRRARPETAGRMQGASGEARPDADDTPPFEDDGGL